MGWIMKNRKWYLLAYDIKNPKRLSRLHYFIKKKAICLQRSVYLVQSSEDELDVMISKIRKIVHDKKDDVRLYPVSQPGAIWSAGQQSGSLAFLYTPAVNGAGKGKSILSSIKKLFTGKNK